MGRHFQTGAFVADPEEVKNRSTALVTALVAIAACLASVLGLGGGAPASARAKHLPLAYAVDMTGMPSAQNPSNPLSGGRWAVNTGYWDDLYPAYARATGTARTYLAKAALQPRALWFTIGNSGTSTTAVADYIAAQQQGDPSVLVQLAIFGIWGYQGEGNRLKHPLTRKEKRAYRAWIQRVSTQVGNARVAIILEPDLALTASRPDLPASQRTKGAAARQALTRYAAQTFHDRNPQVAVYLDAGDADWLSTGQAVSVLRNSGVQYARGFALGATHYSSTQSDIDHGAQIVSALAAAGIRSHFVIDTADNGRPFTYAQFYAKHPAAKGNFFDNSFPCKNAGSTVCNALGVPPTWRVASTALPLSAAQKATAAQLVDSYLWFGRPWLKDQATPFQEKKAILAGKYSPF